MTKGLIRSAQRGPALEQQITKQTFKLRSLAIEIDGELFVIPMNNVKYLQVTPAPEKMPETIIRDGSLINDY